MLEISEAQTLFVEKETAGEEQGKQNAILSTYSVRHTETLPLNKNCPSFLLHLELFSCMDCWTVPYCITDSKFNCCQNAIVPTGKSAQ